MEWIWPDSRIRTNFGNRIEHTQQGLYNELVDHLNSLGAEGWEVVGSTCDQTPYSELRMFWTLKRPAALDQN